MLSCFSTMNVFAEELDKTNVETVEEVKQNAIAQISKNAKWYNPSGDNDNIEFDAQGDIDIDGVVEVTVKVNIDDYYIDSQNSIKAENIKVVDYFDSDKWNLVTSSIFGYDVSNGIISQKDNKIVWSIPNNYNSGYDITLVYYLQLKESYWNVSKSTDYFTNKTTTIKSNDLLDLLEDQSCAHVYYVSNGEEFVENSNNPSVAIRPINWIPFVKKLEISNTNGAYKNHNADYTNTYYINANLLNNDLAISAESYTKRSYDNYKITENIFDIYQENNNQVLAGTINFGETTNNKYIDITSQYVNEGYNQGSIITASAITNKTENVKMGTYQTGYFEYPAKLLTDMSIKVNNFNENVISIYPFVRTTNKNGITYETTRNLIDLKDKRIDLIVDGENPILTPDNKIQTKSESGQAWTESDGYVDINLVDGKVNPNKMTHVLTFRITDEGSGISSPDVIKTDWINNSSDNLQIKLVRVDNDEKVIFDSATNNKNEGKAVKVQYNSSKGINDAATVQIILDPENSDILGHLKLYITAYDNVKNKVEKSYDIYAFCLTAEVKPSSNVPKDGKNENTVALENGERGVVNIEAAGYADSVNVEFDNKLEILYAQEIAQRTSFSEPTVLSGNYPHDDIVNYTNEGSYSLKDSNGLYILPKNLQVNTWGFTATTLGGVDVTDGFNRLNEEAAAREAEKERIREQIAAEKEAKIEEETNKRYSDNYDDDEDIDYDNMTEEEIEEIEAEREAIKDSIRDEVTAEIEATEEPDPFDFVKNDILQETLDQLIYNFSNNTSTEDFGDRYYLNGIMLYTYPTFNNGKISTYAHVYRLNYANAKTIGNKAYPTSIILDGNTNIEVHYEENAGGAVASVENYTDVSTINDQIQASWIETEGGIKRPLSHYFYVPLNTPETYYYIRVTENKDSDTDFKHSVSIEVTFSNTAYGSNSLRDIESYVLDN